jgi:hypothetical protein
MWFSQSFVKVLIVFHPTKIIVSLIAKMTFNYDRIKGFPDRRLLKWNIDYFNAFITADATAMRNLQRNDFFITDVRMLTFNSHLLCSHHLNSLYLH